MTVDELTFCREVAGGLPAEEAVRVAGIVVWGKDDAGAASELLARVDIRREIDRARGDEDGVTLDDKRRDIVRRARRLSLKAEAREQFSAAFRGLELEAKVEGVSNDPPVRVVIGGEGDVVGLDTARLKEVLSEVLRRLDRRAGGVGILLEHDEGG